MPSGSCGGQALQGGEPFDKAAKPKILEASHVGWGPASTAVPSGYVHPANGKQEFQHLIRGMQKIKFTCFWCITKLLSFVRGNLLWLDFDWPEDMFFFVNRVKFFNRIHGHRKHIRIPWPYKSEMLTLAGPWGSWGVSSHSPGGSVAMGIRSHRVKDFSLWESLIVLCICQSKAM
jgi:hypothetical protein